MRVLFVHQNFPGQYGHIAAHYAAQPGNQVVAIGEKSNLQRRQQLRGVKLLGYELQNLQTTPFEASVQRAIHRGKRVATAASVLRRSGFVPDVIFAHIGWGEALFLKDVFPEAKILLYGEFYYRSQGGDMGFDPEYAATPDKVLRLRVMNAPLLMSLDAADWTMAPTRWQWRQFPEVYRSRISVIHDGIDTDAVVPGNPEKELITYVARNLEPYRGFHTFMRAIPEIQKRRPKAHIVIVGGEEVSYSPRLPAGETYRSRLLRELDGRIDLSKVTFFGRIPYADYLSILRRSSVHVYLTYPFVLSWSLLEAMSAGCLIVGSRTPPVEEVIRDGENGLLTDFFSAEGIAERIDHALTIDSREIRESARRTAVGHYDLKRICLPAQLELVEALQRQGADARAAADVEHLAGDEPRVLVGEEQHRPRNVIGLA
jgi:glycosyltransferase involved in cell wall biosynthesis